MWLGEQITERGIGNGISMIIFAGIVAGLPQRDRRHARAGAHRRDVDPLFALVHRRAGRAAVTRSSCSSSAAQRRILVNYAKRQVGNQVYGGQSSHLPFKLNMSGVIPPIFASSHACCSRRRSRSWFGTGRGHDAGCSDIAGDAAPGPAAARDPVRGG